MFFKLILLSILNLILLTTLAQHEVVDIKFIPDKIVIVDDYIIDDGSAQDDSSASTMTTCMQYPSMVYTCPSFQAALEILENNTIINITTNVVLLQSIVHLNQLNNIVIVGQNMTTVECNDSGVLNCSSCSNVTIRGITWSKCGTYREIGNKDFGPVFTYHYPGIIISKCSNIFIQHCVFQNSMASAVYLSEVSDNIEVNHVKFLLNGPRKFTQDMVNNNLENVATGLTIMQPASIQATTKLNISLTRCTFSHNSVALGRLGYSSILLVGCNSMSTTNLNVFISESVFISNGNLYFTQTYGMGTSANIVNIRVLQCLKNANITFTRVTFQSNTVQLLDPSNILGLYIVPNSFTHIQMISCQFINNTAFNVIHFHKHANLGTFSDNAEIHDRDNSYDIKQYSIDVSLNRTDIHIITVTDGCIFRQNVASKSVLYLNNNHNTANQFIIMNSTFENNSETVIYVINQHVTFKEMIQFRNNIAEYGAAIYLGVGSSVSFDENCDITFTSNFARKYGGAIFYDVSQFSSTCENTYMPLQVNNNSAVSFNGNGADIAGNSIYFSISQSCNTSFLRDVQNLVTGINFSETSGQLVTSPNKLVLYSPAALISSTTSVAIYKVGGIMLGQTISISTCVLDYQNNSAGKVLFKVTRVDFNRNYSLIAPNFISLSCESLRASNMQIVGGPVAEGDNSSVTIQFSSSYSSAVNWKPINVNLMIELSLCRPGYFYDDELKQCACYEAGNVVSCLDGNATIMKGYWFGMVNNKLTVARCPINYCDYENCGTTAGICTLPQSLDEQCMTHRTGPACGKCVEGYTLSFDSIKCISTNKCTIGITILVVIITLIYWAVIIMTVFGIMHFQINIGYFYAITYFYSTLDILFEQTLHPSNHAFLYTFVAVLSGVAKVTPRFMGELCIVEGLSAIDQEFMHYIHPLAIWLVIMMITILARFSRRLSAFLSRGIIHVICLLILISFTSGASSTSLSIMHGFAYADINILYVYVSPDIRYFQGRHLFYSIVAYLFVVLIVIGLPLLLLSEPFLNRKIDFTKIKPLLDQFQGCYKDRLRWFASYYMICRQVILNIVIIGYDSFIPLNLLLVTCIIISLIHWLVRPYANKALNIYDGLVLQTMLSIIALQIIYFDNFDSVVPIATAFVLVMLPIFMLLIMAAVINAEHIKKFYMSYLVALKLTKSKEICRTQTAIVREEYDGIVDHALRERSTTVVYVITV